MENSFRDNRVCIAISGAEGFLGWHLRCHLKHATGLASTPVFQPDFASSESLAQATGSPSVVLHLAGMNRGPESEVYETNLELARKLTVALDIQWYRPHDPVRQFHPHMLHGRSKMRHVAWMILLLTFSIAGSCPAQETRRNLALAKPYTMEPAPNYPLCTDPGDRIQLTDGEYVQGRLWSQKGAVGWSNASPVFITLDLGRVEPIGGLSYSTAAGTAGVAYPSSIAVLVSEDGKTWTPVGDLVELGQRQGKAPEAGYHTFRFRAEGLATFGRFVQLIITPTGPFTFVDEIEIYPGPKELLERPKAPGEIRDVHMYMQEFRFRVALRRRLLQDLELVRTSIQQASLGEESRHRLLLEMDGMGNQVMSQERDLTRVQPTEILSTVFPINGIHQRIFAAQAAAWRGGTAGRLVMWRKNRWDMLSPTEPPLPSKASVQVAMMRGEFRAEAFNLTNTTSESMEIAIKFEGIPGGPLPDYIRVHEVPFTDTQSGVPVAAALPLADVSGRADKPGSRYIRIKLIPGLTRQIWLTFHPTSLPAGEYAGRIRMKPLSGSSAEGIIPIQLKVYPFTFPSQPSLHLGGWDYSDRDVIDQVGPLNRDAFIRQLREHFVDSPWAQAAVLPPGRFDQEGRMIEAPDTSEFNKWVRRWPGARRYFVALGVKTQFSGHVMSTPAFESAVAAWITWWVQQLPQWKIHPGQLGLLLVDEPHDAGKDQIVVAWAKAIRAAETGVEIWENPGWGDPGKANPELFSLSDALSPHLPSLQDKGRSFADFYLAQRQAGKRLWFYSASGPGKLLDPYSYHRMQPWFCWKFGAEGAFYWSFSDSNGATDWNEYNATSTGAYTPLFLDPKSVTAGKHMEAIREGVEDVEYLRMLHDSIQAAERNGQSGPALAAAKKLLAIAADQVTACMTSSALGKWTEPKDRSVADRIRIQILDALMSLNK